MSKILTAIGLMSGTSMDGIDAAIIQTDGESINSKGESFSLEYSPQIKEKIRAVINDEGDISSLERELTILHAEAVKGLLEQSGLSKDAIDIIGFHGQTIKHDPDNGVTLQIGDGQLLAELTGINVINDFRGNDVKNGGQGAPLVPLYHQALVKNEDLPVAIVNIGGVGNVTWIGEDNEILAFDTGPGNALIDDFVLQNSGRNFDKNGELAESGEIDEVVLARLIDNNYFDKKPPKSLDRNDFANKFCDQLSLEDGAATLSTFTVACIIMADHHFPVDAKKWYITGGGRHNDFIMDSLRKVIMVPVQKIEELGHDGDMLEAEAFAFLAVRSFYNLPLSLPSTTGVKKAVSGGKLYKKS